MTLRAGKHPRVTPQQIQEA